MESLYRIVSLEGFLSLIEFKKERFVRPIEAWEDTFEGYMLHLLDSEQGLLTVIQQLYSEITDEDINITIMNISKLLRGRFACYGMCWSKLKDSDALWRIYSYNNKAIQIISNKERINKVINDNNKNAHFRIKDVEYDINNETDALKKILVRNSRVDAAYFHKRPAFEHEKEVRVLIDDSENTKILEAFSIQAIKNNLKFTDKTKTVPERIQQAILSLNAKDSYRLITSDALHLNIKDLSQYIEGIRVHPQSEDWYCELIKNYAERNGVNFIGKSELYREII